MSSSSKVLGNIIRHLKVLQIVYHDKLPKFQNLNVSLSSWFMHEMLLFGG